MSLVPYTIFNRGITNTQVRGKKKTKNEEK